MRTLSFTHVRNNFAEVSDQACRDRNPVLVTRQGGDPVVLLSWDDYRSLEETAYLLRSPKNATRLAEALESSGGVDRELIGE